MPWIKIGEQRMDHGELRTLSLRAASALKSLGIRQGDVVAICMRNDINYIIANFGAQHVGAYVTMINWHGAGPEVEYALRSSGAKVLIVHDDILNAVGTYVPDGIEIFHLETTAEIRREYRLGDILGQQPQRGRSWPEWIAGFEASTDQPVPSGGSMIFTSGTTGKPKAVRRQSSTPAEATSTFECYMIAYGAQLHRNEPEAIVAMAAGPLYHAAPSAWTTYYMRLGANLVLEPKFDAERTLRIIEAEKVTHLLAVPTMFVRLLNLPDAVRRRYDLSSLEFVMHGAAPCPPEIKRAMIDWWGPIITEHYGGTEIGVVTFCSADEWLARPGTVGRVMPDCALRVLDADGNDCPPGTTGEIYGRRLLFPDFTYVGDDAKREGAERHGLISLGDMGFLDEDGYLFLNGRSSDMIISGGVNIYPAEIEGELINAPGVNDCAVFGVPDNDLGERVHAVLQPHDGATITTSTIKSYLSNRIASYKMPRSWEIRETLPREDSGKIKKWILRAPHWEGTGRSI